MVRPYLKNTEQLLQVNWGQTVQWDVKFPDAPAPFNNWFPAHGLDRRVISLERMDIKGPLLGTAIPGGEETRELTLQFYDDDKDTLRTWFINWMSDLTTNGLAVATVKEACKKIFIQHLDRNDKTTTLSALHIFPYGALQETFTSGSANGPKGFSLNFVIAGSDKGARMGIVDDSNLSGDGLVKTLTPQNTSGVTSPNSGTIRSV